MKKREPPWTVGCNHIGTNTVESSTVFPQNETALWLSDSTSGNISKDIWNTNSKVYMHAYVHWSIIYNSQDLVAAQVSINRRGDKRAMVHLHYGILLSCKTKQNKIKQNKRRTRRKGKRNLMQPSSLSVHELQGKFKAEHSGNTSAISIRLCVHFPKRCIKKNYTYWKYKITNKRKKIIRPLQENCQETESNVCAKGNTGRSGAKKLVMRWLVTLLSSEVSLPTQVSINRSHMLPLSMQRKSDPHLKVPHLYCIS